ncbi:MAG: PfkB family carbohydrate kinase [Verrucomicrobia bacterium]|nr:PfkB family carbohydrate kinase [Verrucomicrobiota bacterium]
MQSLTQKRVRQILAAARKAKILVIGDAMLDHFVWGRVGRISPEAPVPVVDFQRESFMPGGAANVARNLTALNVRTGMITAVGRDPAGRNLKRLLTADNVDCAGMISSRNRVTSIKTRIIAHQQQVVRLDRECAAALDMRIENSLLSQFESQQPECAAVIVGDYGKGVVTDSLMRRVKEICRARGIWLSLDPKPIHKIDLTDLSLITPNRKEAFELAGMEDTASDLPPPKNQTLLKMSDRLLELYRPALLLITLGEHGMLLCRAGSRPVHIPTVAQEVFDVSGAGDSVIATFTLAVAAGASPLEAAIFSNHAAGVVVGKFGTATVSPNELAASFANRL